MKYEKEYKKYGRKDFIRVVSGRYNIRPQSARRTWYKYRIVLNKVIPIIVKPIKIKKELVLERVNKVLEDPILERVNKVFRADEKQEVSKLKMLMFKDMERYSNNKVTRNILQKNGFNQYEINWLIENGYAIFE